MKYTKPKTYVTVVNSPQLLAGTVKAYVDDFGFDEGEQPVQGKWHSDWGYDTEPTEENDMDITFE